MKSWLACVVAIGLIGIIVVLFGSVSLHAPRLAGCPLLHGDSQTKLGPCTETRRASDTSTLATTVAASIPHMQQTTRFQAIYEAYAKFASMEEEELKNWLRGERKLTSYVEDLDEFTVAITRLAEQDPVFALEMIHEPDMHEYAVWRDLWIDRIFTAWATGDLMRALNAARELPADSRTVAGQSMLLAVQGDSAVAEYIDATLGTSITESSIGARGESMRNDYHSDWQSAIENEVAESSLREIAITWAEVDPLASLDAVVALDNLQHWTSRSGLGSEVVAMWTRKNPELAKSWVASLPASELRGHAMASVFRSLAQIDPRNTLDAATAIPDETDRKLSVTAVLSSWASMDLDGAMSAFESISDPELRKESVFSVAHRLSLADPSAAFYWASTLGTEESSRVIPSIVGQQAAKDPEAATRWLDQIDSRNVKHESAMHIATQWADVDPRSALIWAQTGTVDSIKASAVDRVFTVWAIRNRDEAIAGLDMIGDVEIREMIEPKLTN